MNELQILLTDIKGEVTSTIKKYDWSVIPETQLHAAEQALTKTKYIQDIAAGDMQAVKNAVIKSCILGLDLTEGKNQGWLVPRKNAQGKTVVQLQVGYKGIEAIHQRMGVLEQLSVRIVREKDKFSWSGDDSEKPVHEADWFSPVNRGNIIGVFCVSYLTNGRMQVTVTPITEIYEKHRDISDSWKSETGRKFSPWANHEEAMIMKTSVYIASKQWPAYNKNNQIEEAISETLQEVEFSDYTEAFTKYSKKQKQMFDKFWSEENALGLHLLDRSSEVEARADLLGTLVKSTPRGGKVKAKERLAELQKQGLEIFHEILSAIDNNDKALLIECAYNEDEELDQDIKSLLNYVLDVESQKIFNELVL